MQLRSYQSEALMLIEIAQLLKSNMIAVTMSQTIVQKNGIADNKIDLETYINTQDIVIADQELFTKCTSGEWHLIGRISQSLKMCNALWKCPPDLKAANNTIRKAIKGLLEKNILAKTTVTHFYIVNPMILRRGRDWKVALTTAQAIHDNNGIDDTLIRDLRPIDRFDFINTTENIQQIQYGYSEE